MMDVLYTVFAFIVAIALLVAVHEYGHFITARKLGVKVEKFSIGFGPALFSWRSRDGEVLYIIALIPLGGYVKMLGEGNPAESEHALSEADKLRAFDHQQVWKRAAIAAAGPAANILFAIMAYIVIGWVGQTVTPPIVGAVAEHASYALMEGDRIVQVDDRNIHSWAELEYTLKQYADQTVDIHLLRDEQSMVRSVNLVLDTGEDPYLVDLSERVLGVSPGMDLYIRSVSPGTPAQIAGLQEGDHVIGLQGKPVFSVRSFVQDVQDATGSLLSLQVLRDGQTLLLAVEPAADESGHGRLGVGLAAKARFEPELHRLSFFEGLLYGVERTWDMTVMTLQMFGKMFAASISTENLGGPIAIAQLAGQTASLGMVPFIAFLAIISVNLAVLNLLPVPVLDGGHLVYLAIEQVMGKPLPGKVMVITQSIGMALIVCLMLFAFYNDVFRLLKG